MMYARVTRSNRSFDMRFNHCDSAKLIGKSVIDISELLQPPLSHPPTRAHPTPFVETLRETQINIHSKTNKTKKTTAFLFRPYMRPALWLLTTSAIYT